MPNSPLSGLIEEFTAGRSRYYRCRSRLEICSDDAFGYRTAFGFTMNAIARPERNQPIDCSTNSLATKTPGNRYQSQYDTFIESHAAMPIQVATTTRFANDG